MLEEEAEAEEGKRVIFCSTIPLEEEGGGDDTLSLLDSSYVVMVTMGGVLLAVKEALLATVSLLLIEAESFLLSLAKPRGLAPPPPSSLSSNLQL